MKYLFFLCFVLIASAGRSQIEYNAKKQQWTVGSGKNTYVLSNTSNGVVQQYSVGPKRRDTTSGEQKDYELFSCIVDGKQLNTADLAFVSQRTWTSTNGTHHLALTFKGKQIPLDITVTSKAFDNTGVFSREITVRNASQQVMRLARMASLSVTLPAGNYDLQYLKTEWGKERRLTTEAISPGTTHSLASQKGRSGDGYSSWFSLFNKTASVRYMAQLAYSGNWEMNFLQENSGDPVQVYMGMRFDKGTELTLKPSEEFAVPEAAFTLGDGDLNDLANQMHRYQRRYVIPAVKTNDPLLVEFNTWFAAPNKVYVNEIKKLVDGAAQLGCEAFVLDAGWYNEDEKNWSSNLGDFYVTKTSFPNGLEELVKYVHEKNMLFGLWVEIESAGRESKLAKEHPDWFLQYEGKPLLTSNRYHLNFANKDAWNWALATISRLVKSYDLKWIKIDYNNSVGEKFDENYNGIALYSHLQSYFSLLDSVSRLFPSLIIENCASGGLRTDLGTMKHTHTAWLSDITYPRKAPQLVWGANLEFVPDINNYWMTGDTTANDIWFCKAVPEHPEWWNYLFRIAMNGQFGISSRLERWPESLMNTAKENVALYKRIRTVIKGADVYLLTPMPDHERPQGSMAIQYQNKNSNLLMAYRLENGKNDQNYRLRGLESNRQYTVYLNGKKEKQLKGVELMNNGIDVHLQYDFSAAVVEIK